MVVAAQKASSVKEARSMLQKTLDDGLAFETFKKFIVAQGGCEEEVLHPENLPQAMYIEKVFCNTEGYVNKIHTEKIGRISLYLGGGRETKDSDIDLAVGLILHKKRGEEVVTGEALATIHANSKEKLEQAKQMVRDSFEISNVPVEKEMLIKKIIL